MVGVAHSTYSIRMGCLSHMMFEEVNTRSTFHGQEGGVC